MAKDDACADDQSDDGKGTEPFDHFLVIQQNKALAAAKKEKDRKIAELSRTLREAERRNHRNISKVACMDRYWKQLEADIRRFSEALEKENSASMQIASPTKDVDDAKGGTRSLLYRMLFHGPERRLFHSLDRYLEQVARWAKEDGYVPSDLSELLTAFDLDEGEEEEEDEGEEEQVEGAVKERCLATRAAVEALARRVEELSRGGANQGGGSCSTDSSNGVGGTHKCDSANTPSEPLCRAMDENKRLQQQLALTKDLLVVARKERTELVKQFLIALRRKQRADRQLEWPSEEMATDAREQQGAEGGDSQSHEGMNGSRSPPLRAGVKRKRSGSDGADGKDDVNSDLAATVRDLKELAGRRLEELERERERVSKLENRVTELLMPRKEGEQDVTQHPLYQAQEKRLEQARAEREEAEQREKDVKVDVLDLKAQIELLKAQRQEALEHERSYWMKRIQATEAELNQLRALEQDAKIEAGQKALLEQTGERHRAAKEQAERELGQVRALVSSFRQQLDLLLTEKAALQQRAEALEKEADGRVKRRLEGLPPHEVKDERLAELERELSEAKASSQSLQNFQSQLLEEVSNSAALYEQTVKEVTALQARVEEAERRVVTQTDDAMRSRAAEKVQFDRAAALERKVVAGEAVQRQQDELIRELQQQVQALDEQARSDAEAKEQAEERATALQRELEAVQEEAQRQAQSQGEDGQKADGLLKRSLELSDELKTVKMELTRKTEELSAMNRKLQNTQRKLEELEASGRPSSSSSSSKSSDENPLALLNCSVCNVRWKNVIITKCYHLFCRECVNENLKVRSRKCPACSKSFGQDDVHEIYLT